MNIDKKRFFDCFRTYHKSARGKNLTQGQVDGLNYLLKEIQDDYIVSSVPQIAYFLATVAHETAWTFKPIKEYRGKTLSAAQKKYWPSGYYGRGYVQLTWEKNYKFVGQKLDIPLVENPDLALDASVAYRIAVEGMREGWFTGKKLSDYINSRTTDYINARRIVNGTDRARDIAIIAIAIEGCLKASLVADAGESKNVSATGVEAEGLSPTPDSTQPGPSVNVENAESVVAAPVPLEGGKKDDAPIQASQGGTKSLLATVGGGLAGIFTAAKGWVDGNNMLAVVGIVCVTLLLLVWMFRQVLLDWLRMRLIADPSKLNVR